MHGWLVHPSGSSESSHFIAYLCFSKAMNCSHPTPFHYQRPEAVTPPARGHRERYAVSSPQRGDQPVSAASRRGADVNNSYPPPAPSGQLCRRGGCKLYGRRARRSRRSGAGFPGGREPGRRWSGHARRCRLRAEVGGFRGSRRRGARAGGRVCGQRLTMAGALVPPAEPPGRTPPAAGFLSLSCRAGSARRCARPAGRRA
ncbi:hypothetical protein KIL84_015316 [Mauremys mutica]|uniref:Uncharacterized protein n=1 Tax=Mauremys mutica TaxID=74926 RepID=A0A9D3WQI0_9SAUR|nr:hypothetical protein KIL84_015316 [Mauremys mutica]